MFPGPCVLVPLCEYVFAIKAMDLCAGHYGELDLGPSAEIGKENALYYPPHRTALQLAGKHDSNDDDCIDIITKNKLTLF